MTIGEQMHAALETLSPEHREALEIWTEKAEDHAVLLDFLEWASSSNCLIMETPGGVTLSRRSLVALYLEVDEELADAAREALHRAAFDAGRREDGS